MPMGDAEETAGAIVAPLSNKAQQKLLSENAAMDARQRFDLNRQAEKYWGWYEEILEVWHRGAPCSS